MDQIVNVQVRVARDSHNAARDLVRKALRSSYPDVLDMQVITPDPSKDLYYIEWIALRNVWFVHTKPPQVTAGGFSSLMPGQRR